MSSSSSQGLPFVLPILNIKPNTLFSLHIHEVDSVGAYFAVEKTKAQVHTARKAFRPTYLSPTV